jgi:hypothetical protein
LGREDRFRERKDDIYMCKALAGMKEADVRFYSPALESDEINQIIEEDKKYGTFRPKNQVYYTYRVLSDDKEITSKQVLKSVQYSFKRISLRTNLRFRRARDNEYADLRIDFRTVESDEDKQLTDNTLMYHYYPIHNTEHKLRGLCVVNKKFHWTSNGKPIDMHYIDPVNYPEKGSGYRGKTYDFDQVYTHEVLHGLGLPHSKKAGNVMSPNYGIMAEWMSEEDIARIQAKYGKRTISESRIRRWLNWLRSASDRKI